MNVTKAVKLCSHIFTLLQMYSVLDQEILKNRGKRLQHKRHVQCLLRVRRKRNFQMNRRMWKLNRSSKFWEDEVPTYNDQMFKGNSRMNRGAFNKLVEKLHYMEAQDTHLRRAIPLQKRIGIALYTLTSSAEYRTVASLFGVGRTTVGEIVRDFCDAVCYTLEKQYLDISPTQEKLKEIVRGFEQLGFPQCMGAIDGCHIEVSQANDQAVDYYNFKGWYSIVLLAVADFRCNFTYVNIGSPGRNNDAYIFQHSLIKEEHLHNPIYANNSRNLGGVSVPGLLIGDSAFALSQYMMKPFPYMINQPPLEKTFNYRLSKCRRVVENSFGQLKARFRRLSKGLEVDIENAPLLIRTCCILHNFYNANKDEVFDIWLRGIFPGCFKLTFDESHRYFLMRRMTALSAEQKAFVEECMLEFSNRFSDRDEEYKRIYESDIPSPPIMCPWYARPKFVSNRHRGPGNSRTYDRDFHQDRDNYKQNKEHKYRDRRYRPY